MEPTTRVLSNQSTKSYLERELMVSLDANGPMIGPNLETMDTHREEEEVIKPAWTFLPSKDISDPKMYSKSKKNTILFIVATGAVISPISTTIYLPALINMQQDFNATDITLNASLSIFTFFTAFFPLVWATFGDIYGRRRIYLISFFITVIGSVCCALSVNAEMFIAFRAVSAIGSSSAMSMGAGTIADIFEPYERGRAFSYYSCGALIGPAVGPIIGGYLNEGLGWRSNFWFLSILCFCTWLGFVFFLPETWRPSSPPAIIEEKEPTSPTSSTSSTINQDTLDKKKRRFINPIGALKLFLYPNIALTIAFVGVLFFVLYLNNTNFTRTYTIQYGMKSGIVGVCYLPSAVGSMIGGILAGRMSDRIYMRRVAKAKAEEQEVYPEMRLGGPIFYAALFLQLAAFTAFGWCIEKNVHFAYGLVCQFFLGLALMLPNITLSAYMVDCFRKKGASVTACNNFARYAMAGIGSLIASDILRALGSGILFTLCGCFLLIASVNLLIVTKYTKKWALLRSRDTS